MPGDEGYGLEPAELTAIAGHLGEAGTALGDHESTLAVTPDAGRSSDEVVQAFAILATAVGAGARHVQEMSSTLSTNVRNYDLAERHASGAVNAAGGPL